MMMLAWLAWLYLSLFIRNTVESWYILHRNVIRHTVGRHFVCYICNCLVADTSSSEGQTVSYGGWACWQKLMSDLACLKESMEKSPHSLFLSNSYTQSCSHTQGEHLATFAGFSLDVSEPRGIWFYIYDKCKKTKQKKKTSAICQTSNDTERWIRMSFRATVMWMFPTEILQNLILISNFLQL